MKQKIMIVGNGEVLPGAAGLIDSSDLVIRFNDCRTYGEAGEKTDVVAICNTGRPGKARLASADWASHPAVQQAGAIWSVRDPAKFTALRGVLAVSHPELDDFCDDYTADFARLCVCLGKKHSVISRAVHEAVDTQLQAFAPEPYVVPSSGLIVIAFVLESFRDAEISIAGFGHEGWEGHPFAAERKLVERLIGEGHLSRLQPLEGVTAPSIPSAAPL